MTKGKTKGSNNSNVSRASVDSFKLPKTEKKEDKKDS